MVTGQRWKCEQESRVQMCRVKRFSSMSTIFSRETKLGNENCNDRLEEVGSN